MWIRQAEESDASSLAVIAIEVWAGTYLKEGVSAFFADFLLSQMTAPVFETALEDPSERFLVSQNTGGIDGFVRVSLGRKPPVSGASDCEIATLYVQPRHHGKGIGKALLAAALEACRREGAVAPWLMVNSENQRALRFYAAQGFAHLGQTEFRIVDQAYPNEVFCMDLRDGRRPPV